jgi:hypothetical protein
VRPKRAKMARLLTAVSGCTVIFLCTLPIAWADGSAVGVNIVNPQRLSFRDRESVLHQLHAAGARIIRVPLAPPWSGTDYRPAVDFIRRAYDRGIKTDLNVGLQYPEGTERRPALREIPAMWPSFPLSSADPEKFKAVFERLFNDLEGFGITFAALELGNEINWAAFNGDFPIPGRGRVLGRQDLDGDPQGRQIADGYGAYLRTLRVMKDIRDRSLLNAKTPIISAGLADPGFAGPRPGAKADAVTIAATIQYLRENGLDALVDAYGVHTYPWAKTSTDRLVQLEEDTLAECHSPSEGKPCWLTEWGFPADTASCPGNDAGRSAQIRELLTDLGKFARERRLDGLIYFSWDDKKYGIYRCGSLTESGRLALDFDLLQ